MRMRCDKMRRISKWIWWEIVLFYLFRNRPRSRRKKNTHKHQPLNRHQFVDLGRFFLSFARSFAFHLKLCEYVFAWLFISRRRQILNLISMVEPKVIALPKAINLEINNTWNSSFLLHFDWSHFKTRKWWENLY